MSVQLGPPPAESLQRSMESCAAPAPHTRGILSKTAMVGADDVDQELGKFMAWAKASSRPAFCTAVSHACAASPRVFGCAPGSVVGSPRLTTVMMRRVWTISNPRICSKGTRGEGGAGGDEVFKQISSSCSPPRRRLDKRAETRGTCVHKHTAWVPAVPASERRSRRSPCPHARTAELFVVTHSRRRVPHRQATRAFARRAERTNTAVR